MLLCEHFPAGFSVYLKHQDILRVAELQSVFPDSGIKIFLLLCKVYSAS